MKPHRVLGFGALKHRERPATHNVGTTATCCGELRLSFDPNPFRWLAAGEWVILRCACGAIVEAIPVLPEDAEWEIEQRDDEDDVEPWGV